MQTKKCFKCGLELPIDDFYEHKMMADGHLNKCKDCTKKDARKCRESRIEYYRAYDRARGNRQSVEYKREYRHKYKEKLKCRNAVTKGIMRGKIKKPDECSVCGSSFHIEAHHPDYMKPLEVIWLCSACHSAVHKKI